MIDDLRLPIAAKPPRLPRRPGPGWRRFPDSAVFEHTSGLRVHMHGMARLPNGRWITGTILPEYLNVQRAIREQGGRRRGLLVWGLSQLSTLNQPATKTPPRPRK